MFILPLKVFCKSMYYMFISYMLYAHINNQYDPNISYIKLDETPMLNEVN